MSTFVTGGTGFIGRRVVCMLLDQGESVHLLARNPEPLRITCPDGLRVFAGDVQDLESVRQGIQGCDRACHMAAYAKAWTRDPSVFHRVNVIGTRNVLACAAEAGISHVVHTSSCSAVQFKTAHEARESDLSVPEVFPTEYALSKSLAEHEVERFRRSGLHVVTLYPTRVYGPGPLSDANAATKVMHLYLRNRLPIPRSHLNVLANWVFADDVAQGHVLALEKGVCGSRYILGGENASLQGVLDLLDRLTAISHLRIVLPEYLAGAFAKLQEAKARCLGIPPLVTRPWLRALQEPSVLSSAKAVLDLGYRITPLRDGLSNTIEWLMSRQFHPPAGL